ncbi:hypothetical protein BKA81DRAFT_160653 [Phyllosticta paracitricarpa]
MFAVEMPTRTSSLFSPVLPHPSSSHHLPDQQRGSVNLRVCTVLKISACPANQPAAPYWRLHFAFRLADPCMCMYPTSRIPYPLTPYILHLPSCIPVSPPALSLARWLGGCASSSSSSSSSSLSPLTYLALCVCALAGRFGSFVVAWCFCGSF